MRKGTTVGVRQSRWVALAGAAANRITKGQSAGLNLPQFGDQVGARRLPCTGSTQRVGSKHRDKVNDHSPAWVGSLGLFPTSAAQCCLRYSIVRGCGTALSARGVIYGTALHITASTGHVRGTQVVSTRCWRRVRVKTKLGHISRSALSRGVQGVSLTV